MLAQYKAGLAKFEESSTSQNAAEAVEEKQAIEEELKQHERILRKLRVGRRTVMITTLACTDGVGIAQGRIDQETTTEATARAHFNQLAGTRKTMQNAIEQHERELEAVKKTRDVSNSPNHRRHARIR